MKNTENEPTTDSTGTPSGGDFPRAKNPLWIDILAIIGVLIVANVLAGMLGQVISGMRGADDSLGTFVAYIFSFGITIAFALWLNMRQRGKGSLSLKFRSGKTSPSLILWGLILVFAVSTILEPLLALFPDEFMKVLDNAVGSGIWAVITTVVCAPILEEILFRGIIQQSCTREYGAVRGVIAGAAIFGIVHVIPQQVVNAFFVGIILGYIYIKTRSLTPVIIIHALNNAIAFLFMRVFRPDGEEKFSDLRDMIGNDTFYWILYALLAVVVVIAGVHVFRYLSSAKNGEQP